MTSRMNQNGWSEESLVNKARLYVEQMEACGADDWQFGFWSALSLELLARAALAHFSPVLLADHRDWRNLAHALGNSPTRKRFSPRSLTTIDVYKRLEELVPAFTDEIFGFCISHADRRNLEIHSGELAFTSLEVSEWLPQFYQACKVLLESMGRKFEEFVSDPLAAQQMIDSREDTAQRAVQEDIRAYRTVWSNKSREERNNAAIQATAWATRHTGHRVVCPACSSNAVVQGTPSGPVARNVDVDGDEVVERQKLLPSSFECIACGLRIVGFSRLSTCRLGGVFTAKSTYTAAEFFGLYTEDELEKARSEWPAYEDDFNE